MPRINHALALCRVSTIEQLENNSLNRQRDAVLKAAEDLNVIIPDDGWWSGSVSSKRGTNLGRKDLQEMLERCEKDKRIKYIIVDEPDRFMRSIDEAAYFEVMFRELGVKVWYASDPDLNKGDLASKLLKFTKYLSAEGSNEERQRKSISGQTKALLDGRYTFSPKPGYKRGYERGIQEIHPVRGPALQSILVKLAEKLVTPSKALVELNNGAFMDGHALYKMDKFRKIVTDPFYAGIVEINKQVQVRNENGLHEPLITKDQHYELLKIMNDKKKNQSGPRQNGNPKYPLSNHVIHDGCTDKRGGGKLVGLDLRNGKPNSKTYEKYRCRSCGKYVTRDELHSSINRQFQKNLITPVGRKELIKALEIVWRQRENQKEQETNRLQHKLESLYQTISQQVEAATNPDHITIKEEILEVIGKKKEQVAGLEEQLEKLRAVSEQDKARFMSFALDFVDNLASHFFDISPENRARCKEIVFPSGFHLDQNQKVYTSEISPLYRLVTKKKSTEVLENSHLVHSLQKSLHEISGEMARWRDILAVPYQQYLLNR